MTWQKQTGGIHRQKMRLNNIRFSSKLKTQKFSNKKKTFVNSNSKSQLLSNNNKETPTTFLNPRRNLKSPVHDSNLWGMKKITLDERSEGLRLNKSKRWNMQDILARQTMRKRQSRWLNMSWRSSRTQNNCRSNCKLS